MTNIPEYIPISVGGRTAGTLHSLGEGSGFNYDQEWRSAAWVSLAMPPRAKSWLWARGLHPVFDMNLPEGSHLEILKSLCMKRYGRADDFYLLGMLSRLARGRIEYRCPWFRDGLGYGAGAADPGSLPLSDVVDSKDPELFRRLQDLFLARSFVSGVQPKVLARLVEKSSFVPRDYIVKTWGNECPRLAENEYFCMTAARRAGISVPHFELSADSRLFVVERFDIDRYGHILGFEELCALQGKNAADKYSGSYEGAARTVGAFASDDFAISAFEGFFSMLALSMLLRNGNAHLKNFGILYSLDRQSRELAPCYDVVTTATYDPKGLPALSFSGRKFWPNRKQLVDFGVSACNLDRKRAGELWDICVQGVADTRRDVLSHARECPGFRDVAESMLAAWDAGLADRQ
jgi:serine/threonine-protein kinase HipA